MKAVIQRVLSAGVTVAGEEVASIGPGALILLGIASADDEMLADKLAKRSLNCAFSKMKKAE